jgi:3-hydroxyacyl-[acyl-carrier-protein] dehydratase
VADPAAFLPIWHRLPHRYPFLLVDRIVERKPGELARAYKNVTINEPFFMGHFPGYPVMPGVLILEALAQTAGLALPDDGEGRMGLLTGIDRARIRRPVGPGDRLDLVARITRRHGSAVRAEGTASVDGETVAEAEILFMLVEPPAPSTGLGADGAETPDGDGT